MDKPVHGGMAGCILDHPYESGLNWIKPALSRRAPEPGTKVRVSQSGEGRADSLDGSSRVCEVDCNEPVERQAHFLGEADRRCKICSLLAADESAGSQALTPISCRSISHTYY